MLGMRMRSNDVKLDQNVSFCTISRRRCIVLCNFCPIKLFISVSYVTNNKTNARSARKTLQHDIHVDVQRVITPLTSTWARSCMSHTIFCSQSGHFELDRFVKFTKCIVSSMTEAFGDNFIRAPQINVAW